MTFFIPYTGWSDLSVVNETSWIYGFIELIEHLFIVVVRESKYGALTVITALFPT